ncbi:8778_t:CDS:2, partial [Scutellospora calospora]
YKDKKKDYHKLKEDDDVIQKKYVEIEKAELQYKQTYTVNPIQPYDDNNGMQELPESLSSTSDNEICPLTKPKEILENDENIVNDMEDYYNEAPEFESKISG